MYALRLPNGCSAIPPQGTVLRSRLISRLTSVSRTITNMVTVEEVVIWCCCSDRGPNRDAVADSGGLCVDIKYEESVDGLLYSSSPVPPYLLRFCHCLYRCTFDERTRAITRNTAPTISSGTASFHVLRYRRKCSPGGRQEVPRVLDIEHKPSVVVFLYKNVSYISVLKSRPYIVNVVHSLFM